ncbi:MAG: hypothetical protein DI539_15040, partial [Flavobacterium psychrophilum]
RKIYYIRHTNLNKPMKKILCLLLLAAPLLSIAQINFEKGYFIENGIKTECLIKNLGWKNNPTSFEYKLDENDTPKTKTISTVTEFNVNESYKFVKVTTNIDRSESNIDRLDNSKEPQWQTGTVYLKALVEGKITLYQYEDNNLIRYFISTEDSAKSEQLVYKEYLFDGRIAENNLFRQQLYNLMKGENFTLPRFENLKYKKNDLVKLFTEYNAGTGKKMNNLSEKQNKGKVNVRFTPGMTINSFDISNNVSGYEFDFGSKTSYRIGAELEYVLPFNNNKWSLFFDPNYQSFKNEGNRGSQKMEFSYQIIELPFGVRHHMYLSDKSRFFVDAAYIASVTMGDTYLKNGPVSEIDNNSAIAIGAGYGYKKYSIEARYTLEHGILGNYVSWESNFSTLSIILGYNFL